MSGENLAYHLRPNKIVDRSLFVESIKRVRACLGENSAATYYGMGGPFLEDFKVMHGHFPEMNLYSIEMNRDTHRRQKFHAFKSGISFYLGSFHDWLTEEFEPEKGDIIWADYTSALTPDILSDFGEICLNAAENTVIKITVNMSLVRANSGHSRRVPYADTFGDYAVPIRPRGEQAVQNEYPESDLDAKDSYAVILLAMFKRAANRFLRPGSGGLVFVPVQCVRYADSAPMFCITGVVCSDRSAKLVRREFSKWEFGLGKQDEVLNVAVPELSLKEKLVIESLIPPKSKWVTEIRNCLGYSLDRDAVKARKVLWDYCRFARYQANFAKMES